MELQNDQVAAHLNPDAVGAAVAQHLSAAQLAAAENARSAQYDITDPLLIRQEKQQATHESSSTPKQSGGDGTAPISADLLQRAADVGIPEDEAKSYQPSQLSRIVGRLERQSAPPPRQQEQVPQFQFDPWTGKPLNAQPEPQLPFAPAEKIKLKNAEDGTEYELDPAMVAAIAERDKHFLSEINGLKQQLAQQQQQSMQRQQIEAYHTVENFFESKSKDYAEIFGNGSFDDVGPKEQRARMELAEEAEAVIARAVRNGRRPPSQTKALDKALAILHGDHAAKQATQRLSEQARNRLGQFVARPSASAVMSNGDMEPTTDAERINNIDAFIRRQREGG